jgi:endonuclease-8
LQQPRIAHPEYGTFSHARSVPSVQPGTSATPLWLQWLMPEGPEIRRAADQLARVLVGRVAEQVWFATPALRRYGARLSGQRILAVAPRGKALLTSFAAGSTVYTHNQLYGRWSVVKRDALPDTARSLRLAIHTATHSALLYSATDIEVLPTASVDQQPYIAKLGVELLAPTTQVADALAAVNSARYARRSLAGLLLDQAFLAGIGNYLRSEILYVARLRPEQRLQDLDEAARHRLATAALELTRQSYRTRGITNDLERAAELKATGLAFGRYRHHVFDREQEPCWTCGTRIQRLSIAGRAVFLCPGCQPASRARQPSSASR